MKNFLSWSFLFMLPLFAFIPGTYDIVEDSSSYHCHVENTAFQSGESVTYKVFYNWNFIWVAAGEVTFSVEDLGDSYRFSANGSTYESYDWFYRVKDHYESIVDKNTLLPIQYLHKVEEGNYTQYQRIEFDRERGIATTYKGKTEDQLEVTFSEIDYCDLDLVSVIYHTRNIDLDQIKKDKYYHMSIFMDKELWPLDLNYLGNRKSKRIKGLGTFNLLKMSPDVVVGDIFNEDSKMIVWVGNDDNRLPIMIESPISVGSVKAILKDYENLRHPLDCQIE